MKLSLTVTQDLHFEIFKYDQASQTTFTPNRIWIIKQYPGDPATATPLVMRLRDLSTDAITRHLIAESAGYNPHLEHLDFHWTLHTGANNDVLSLLGNELGVIARRFDFSRQRLEERLKAVFDLMNSTEEFVMTAG
jgi:hypothetical protein